MTTQSKIPQSKKKHLTKQLHKRAMLGRPTVVLSDAAQHQSLLLESNKRETAMLINPTVENAVAFHRAESNYNRIQDRQIDIYGHAPYWEYRDQKNSGHFNFNIFYN